MPRFTHGRDDTALPPDGLGTRPRRLRVLTDNDVALINGPVFLVGLFYAVSPYVLGFADTHHDLAVHDLVVGCAICALAAGFTVAPERMTGLSAALGVTGLWMALAPWAVAHASPGRGAAVAGVVFGVLALVLGLVSAALVRRANRVP
ncbi:SPW repeat protein [Streptomyces anthocyanicus]|uniref:SPW repeat protein n=1 Tax=Streptomyces anthocyanicus TaxID=68174 RepID=UPI002F90CD73|nr:SPW repeat protein [Streptomyces anthocyanicus]